MANPYFLKSYSKAFCLHLKNRLTGKRFTSSALQILIIEFGGLTATLGSIGRSGLVSAEAIAKLQNVLKRPITKIN